jgi:hypothetical protein
MKFKRFFSFGCSWTKWFWPTWADIIAKDLDIGYQNWGCAGSGNQGIQSRFVEANSKFKFNEDDLIIVQWSGWNREDRFINGWKFGGSIFNNPFYDRKFIKRHWSYDNDIIKNSVIIQTTNDAYSKIINYQFSLISPLDREYTDWNDNSHETQHTNSVINSYYSHLPAIDVPKFVNNKFKGRCKDLHPDVIYHLDIVEKLIYPTLFKNSSVKKETKDFFTDYYNNLSDMLSLTDSWETMERKSHATNEKYNLDLRTHCGI